MTPISYLENTAIKSLIETEGKTYQKKEMTALRRVKESEIGTLLITYVSDNNGGYRQESQTPLMAGHIIARNTTRVLGTDEAGQPVYNTWPMETATAEKNYGKEAIEKLSADEFTHLRKKALVVARSVDAKVMDMAGFSAQDATAKMLIKVSWSPEPMQAAVGDFLTLGGYSISKADMGDYIEVSA